MNACYERPDAIGGIFVWGDFFHNGTYHLHRTDCKVVYAHGSSLFDEFQDQNFWYHFLENEWIGGMKRK